MKTVYIVTGVSGSGKSWVVDNVRFNGLKLKSDSFKDLQSLVDRIHETPAETILVEKTTLVSNLIKTLQGNYIVKLLIVKGDFLQVKKQLLSRGGRITPTLYKRWKRMGVLENKYGALISGSSTDVKQFLENEVKNNIVYMATSPSGKMYIGQTSKSLAERKAGHMYDAKKSSKNYLHNVAFHNALNRYRDAMVWTVIESNLSVREANISETDHIALYNSIKEGYNLTHGGKQHYRHTEATKKLIAEKAGPHSKLHWAKEGRREQAANTSKRSWQDPTIKANRISGIKRSRSSAKQRKISSEDSKSRYSNSKKRDEMAIACGGREFEVRKDGDLVGRWVNAAQCAKDLNFLTKTHISNCLHGRSKTYRGYTFNYVSEINDK